MVIGFSPFGAGDFEYPEPGELVFTGGHTVQTRRWLWQQSELGKMDFETSDVFFQLVGFGGEQAWRLDAGRANTTRQRLHVPR